MDVYELLELLCCPRVHYSYSYKEILIWHHVHVKYAVLVYKCLHGSIVRFKSILPIRHFRFIISCCHFVGCEPRPYGPLCLPYWRALSGGRCRGSSVTSFQFIFVTDCQPHPTVYRRCPSFSGRHCSRLNSLPDVVTAPPSVAVFRSRLTTHLFNIPTLPHCDCTVPAQWRLVALDTIIVLPYLTLQYRPFALHRMTVAASVINLDIQQLVW